MKIKLFIVSVALILTSAGTAQAQFPGGWGFSIARRYVGPQIRQASPRAYSGLLAANRSIPPQVKNNWNKQLNPYRSGGTPWNAELNYWRSMPPEVRNNIVRQQQMGYVAQPQPQIIYVPVPTPSASMPTGGRPNTAMIPAPPAPGYIPAAAPSGIPAPPPPSELPYIVRP